MNQIINFKHKGINYKLIQTKKYKVISGIISFTRKLEKEELTYYSLLNRLINSACEKYPTKNTLSNKMYELYDCTAYMSSNYTYKTANTSFFFSVINQKYTNTNLFEQCIELVKEIMLKPLVDNNGFNIKNFKEEKKGLEIDIKNIYNNKARYANYKFLQNVYPNDILSELTLGNLDVLNTITPQSLYEFYLKILNDSCINIGVIGDVSKDDLIAQFDDFYLNSKNIKTEKYPKDITFKDKVLIVKEYQDIVQARLVIGFKHNVDYYSKHYFSLLVFDAMFGGMFGSTLFMNIRENNSLTYDISSSFSISKKILIVTCGLDKKNIELTTDLVIKDFENYCNGQISKSLLLKAKAFLINDLKEVEDFPFSSLSFAMESDISNRPNYEQTIKGIEDVQIDDIIELCKNIKLDTIFSLEPGDNNE